MQYIAERFEALGYTSWAYRIVNSSGAPAHARSSPVYDQVHAPFRQWRLYQTPFALVIATSCACGCTGCLLGVYKHLQHFLGRARRLVEPGPSRGLG